MVKTLISVDVTKKPLHQSVPLHNRWHPDIPPVAHVEPGDSFRLECIDWTGGQISNNDTPDDIATVNLTQVHYLTGPVAITGTNPGDLLVVDILDIGFFKDHAWGYTGIFAKKNGGGFLTDLFPQAAKAIWDLDGEYAQSRHIPGVRFAGIAHPGLIGVAPSKELLHRWNKRESDLFYTNPSRVPPLAALPNVEGALMGSLIGNSGQKAAQDGARTVPGRENGGNCDISSLTRGSRIYFPVFVKDALLSVGDLHFSQGDGEISFCGAIEMAGWIDLKVDVIEQGALMYDLQSPIFKPTLPKISYTNYLSFEGISVDDQGNQDYINATLSYRQSCMAAIEYLRKFGYTGEQAYLLLSAAPTIGRINAIVDIPNAVTSLSIPTEIFDFDIHPTNRGPVGILNQ